MCVRRCAGVVCVCVLVCWCAGVPVACQLGHQPVCARGRPEDRKCERPKEERIKIIVFIP